MRKSLVLAGLLAIAACDVGTVQLPNGEGPDGGSGTTSDGGGSGSGSGSGSGLQGIVAIARSTNIVPVHVHSAGGTHAGVDCMTCHAKGASANIEFQIAGTLYDTAGTLDPGGAIIEVQVNSTGPVTQIVTDSGGNFYIGNGEGDGIGSAAADAFPAKVAVTAAPTLTPMSATVISTGGGCNSCHNTPPTGGAAGPLTLQ